MLTYLGLNRRIKSKLVSNTLQQHPTWFLVRFLLRLLFSRTFWPRVPLPPKALLFGPAVSPVLHTHCNWLQKPVLSVTLLCHSAKAMVFPWFPPRLTLHFGVQAATSSTLLPNYESSFYTLARVTYAFVLPTPMSVGLNSVRLLEDIRLCAT